MFSSFINIVPGIRTGDLLISLDGEIVLFYQQVNRGRGRGGGNVKKEIRFFIIFGKGDLIILIVSNVFVFWYIKDSFVVAKAQDSDDEQIDKV